MKEKSSLAFAFLLAVSSSLAIVSATVEDPYIEARFSESQAPDLQVEGILLPYLAPIFHIYPPQLSGFAYKINATVANQGTADAGAFNVSFSAYWETEQVPMWLRTETIADLKQNETETVQFEFHPREYGNYTLVLVADCDDDVNELDETNNVKTAWVIASITGDIMGDLPGSPPDGDVDRYDFGAFADVYGRQFEAPPYHPADFDYDGDIDRYDFGTLADNYGKTV